MVQIHPYPLFISRGFKPLSPEKRTVKKMKNNTEKEEKKTTDDARKSKTFAISGPGDLEKVLGSLTEGNILETSEPLETMDLNADIALSRVDSIGLASDIVKMMPVFAGLPMQNLTGKVADKIEAIFVMYHLERCKKCEVNDCCECTDYHTGCEGHAGKEQHLVMMSEMSSR